MRRQPIVALGLALPVLIVFGLALLPRNPEATAPVAISAYVPPKGYVCYRAKQPLRIDGRIDEADWQSAPWSDSFVDIEGSRRPAPRLRTRVKMLWDDTCLYLAAQLEEPHLQASFTKRDSYIFHEDNDFEVFLDPDGDNQYYAELEMNALNTTWDLLLTRPYKYSGKPIDAWDIDGLRTAVHIDGTLNDPRDVDRGWTIEIVWPWKGLKQLTTQPLPPGDGDQWRINFSRVQWEFAVVDGKYRRQADKKEDNWVWSPQHSINMHLPEHWGYLQFSTAAPGTATFQPDPAGPVRHALHRIHDAQVAYHKKHDRWASSLRALGMDKINDSTIGRPRLETTTQLYEVTSELRLPDGTRENWSINNDGRIQGIRR